MFLSKWTKISLGVVSLVFAFAMLLLFNAELGLVLMPFAQPSSVEMYVDFSFAWVFGALSLFPLLFFTLSAIYFARDLFISKAKVFAPSKSTLVSGAAAFFFLVPAALAYAVYVVISSGSSPFGFDFNALGAVIVAVGLALAGLVIGKILLNEYFGLRWHEHATPHVLKKISGRRR